MIHRRRRRRRRRHRHLKLRARMPMGTDDPNLMVRWRQATKALLLTPMATNYEALRRSSSGFKYWLELSRSICP